MQRRQSDGMGRCSGFLVGLLFLWAGWGAYGQVGAGGGDEVKRLREELRQAREEIRLLREENARLRGGTPPSAPASVSVPVTGSPAPGGGVATSGPASTGIVVPAGSVVMPPPIEEGASVTVEQLLSEYRQSTLAGDARYKGRRFRLEGTVRGFKKTFGGLTWIVELQSEGQLGLVRCSFSVPGFSDYRAGDRVLEGRRPFKAWERVLVVGERLKIEGTGAGVNDAMVVMKDCRPAS